MKTDLLYDSFGRRVRLLRISLTELCNFRCTYCTAGSMSLVPPAHHLTRQEICRFVEIAGTLGISEVRLTGGEPLLRKDLVDIIRSLKAIRTVSNLSITTNGSLLSEMLADLRISGLDRINISLDSMNRERFKEVTLVDAYRKVMQAVFLALEYRFPVKINMVALRGLSREEILSFVALARDWPLDVRFLEFMPLCGESWEPKRVLTVAEIRSVVMEHYQLEELPRGDSPAQTFKLTGGKGRIGFIGSLTESFCGQCSRIRLSSDGNIKPCLFSNLEVPVKALLRTNASDDVIRAAIRRAAAIKPAGNRFHEEPFHSHRDYRAEQTQTVPLIRKIGG